MLFPRSGTAASSVALLLSSREEVVTEPAVLRELVSQLSYENEPLDQSQLCYQGQDQGLSGTVIQPWKAERVQGGTDY